MIQSFSILLILLCSLFSVQASSLRSIPRSILVKKQNALDAASALQSSTSFLECQIGVDASAAANLIPGSSNTATVKCINPISDNVNLVVPTLSIDLINTATVASPAAPPSLTFPASTTTTSTSVTSTTSSTSTTATSSSKPLTSDNVVALQAHNRVRAIHQAPPLKWDDDLASAAARWSSGCKFERSEGSLFPAGHDYGENIYVSSPVVTMSTVMDAFMAEESAYNYTAGVFTSTTGQFTQAVWVDTQIMGCAISVCNLDLFGTGITKSTFATCLYDPPGNFYSEFLENVLPSL